MICSSLPIATLAIKGIVKGPTGWECCEPVYGGYANGRREVVLFAKDLAYRVNFSLISSAVDGPTKRGQLREVRGGRGRMAEASGHSLIALKALTMNPML